ncbi:hypothetical protein Hanom_Chr14g01246071 [Helianthus anomalus]
MESGVTDAFCSLPTKTSASYSTPWNNCTPPSCGSDLVASPNCQCAHPFIGLFSFKAPSFSTVTNATIYDSLHNLLMSFFKNASLPVDSLSLSNPSRNLEDYLVLRIQVFPSGQPNLIGHGLLGLRLRLAINLSSLQRLISTPTPSMLKTTSSFRVIARFLNGRNCFNSNLRFTTRKLHFSHENFQQFSHEIQTKNNPNFYHNLPKNNPLESHHYVFPLSDALPTKFQQIYF